MALTADGLIESWEGRWVPSCLSRDCGKCRRWSGFRSVYFKNLDSDPPRPLSDLAKGVVCNALRLPPGRVSLRLRIAAGSLHEAEDQRGVAHFLEHMLFLGTEKYPDGNEYQKFISQYGGSNNAWTATEHTCFFFDIHNSHFAEAIDRFSRFFYSPLLSESFDNKIISYCDVSGGRENFRSNVQQYYKSGFRCRYTVPFGRVN